jgi:hypothetical protein
VGSGQGIDSHRVVIYVEEQPAIIDSAAQGVDYICVLPFGSVVRTQNLQRSFVVFAAIVTTFRIASTVRVVGTITGLVAMLGLFMAIAVITWLRVVMPFVFFATFVPILRMQFQPRRASLGIAVALHISIVFAQADDQSLIRVWRWIEAEVEAGDLKLQHPVMDKGADSRGYVHRMSLSSPLRAHQLTTLGHCRTRQQ